LLGELALLRNDPDSALPLLSEALAMHTAVLGPDHWRAARDQSALGACLRRLGRDDESRQLLGSAVTVLTARRPPGDRDARAAQMRLAALP
ncbi:MAG: tetratricopeptide repeat protein, partial [Planctomycetota bacterium]|nr:tetratricopeptide repeat protein [Planctomycetota bacterium]